MKINAINNNAQSFKGIYTNKMLLKGLETISEHGTSFIAATSLVMASGVRPLVISKTPKVKKENKQYLIANSFISGLIKFLTVEAIALPIENAIKKIDKSPEKYLNQTTISNLKDSAENIIQANNYKFATQFLKLSSGLLSAIPKSIITIALIPIVMDKIFNKKKTKNTQPKQELNSVFEPIHNNKPSFKGLGNNQLPKLMGDIINNETFQTYIKNNSHKAPDIARNMSIATDVLLTASFVNRTQKSKSIKQDKKKILIFNNLISTAISIFAGFSIDKAVKKGTKNFINKFSELNKNDPKLSKYIEGINIVRPTLIFAGLYYGVLPIISTLLTEKAEKLVRPNKMHDNQKL